MRNSLKLAALSFALGASIAVAFYAFWVAAGVFPEWLLSINTVLCPPYVLFIATAACEPLDWCSLRTLLTVAVLNGILYTALGTGARWVFSHLGGRARGNPGSAA